MTLYDAIVIGSGFGGSMIAHELVGAGRRVLMLERGGWVPRGEHNWGPSGSLELTPHYSRETPVRTPTGGYGPVTGACYCVGGPSVFYGGVAFRLRERDFEVDPHLVADSGAAWPFGYRTLEPYYTRAEHLIGVAGDDDADPTRPGRTEPFPRPAPPLARVSEHIAGAARSLGLSPFPLPLAINFQNGAGRNTCLRCTTCDTFACGVEAKNDLATTVIRPLMARGLELRTGVAVNQLVAEGDRIVGVRGLDRERGESIEYRAERVILAAGALASPHLLLASDLPRRNPGGDVVGRYLMRHCNAMVFGVFPRPPDRVGEFHKQIAIHDYYFGDERARGVEGKLGGMQQVATPPTELVKSHLPLGLRGAVAPFVSRLTGLLVMAEDQPRADNRLRVDSGASDDVGLPPVTVVHRYTRRDDRARRQLVRRAKQVLRRAGAWMFHTHRIKTFSHAVGTVRMGTDPVSSALDEMCRFRGFENLYVVDGSALPRSGGVNPSLTIAANALRVGEAIVKGDA